MNLRSSQEQLERESKQTILTLYLDHHLHRRSLFRVHVSASNVFGVKGMDSWRCAHNITFSPQRYSQVYCIIQFNNNIIFGQERSGSATIQYGALYVMCFLIVVHNYFTNAIKLFCSSIKSEER